MEDLTEGDPRRIGGYSLVARLGAGAMGAVYLGRSPGGRAVAVKVVHPGLARDPSFRERFRREVEMARTVGGFWTAAVLDAGPDDPSPWLATEFVAGPTLQEAVTLTGPLPETAVRRLAAGLAEALVAIHAAGLVHRDIKPSNVLLASDGPRLIDFGISRAFDHTALTATGSVFGTPGYTAPEQAAGGRTEPASDVFSLGAVLVFAATGTGPFGTGERDELLRRPQLGRVDAGGTPAALRPLVDRCLLVEPGARPTPSDVLAQLQPSSRPDGAQDWLPAPVRTLVADRATELAGHAPVLRAPTRPYTMVGSPMVGPPMVGPPMVGHGSPRAPERAVEGRTGGAGPIPVLPRAVGVDRRPGGPGPAGAAAVRGCSGPAFVITVHRRWAALRAGLCLLGVLWGAGLASRGSPGEQLLGLIVFVVLGVWGVRLAVDALRAPVAIEIDAGGIIASRGRRQGRVPWSQVARIGVARGPSDPWLAVWFAGPAPLWELAHVRLRAHHGGYRILRVGSHRTRRARAAEVRELRAALGWHAGPRHDPYL